MPPFLLFLLLFFVQESSTARDPAKPNPPTDSSEVDNKHVRTARYIVAPHQEVALPKLVHESLLLCLRGQSLKLARESGPTDALEGGPGTAITIRGGISYRVENPGDNPEELLVVELKESYAVGQMTAPWSERDPTYIDPRHFRLVLDNPQVSVLRLHLDARDGTEQSQLTPRLEIPLANIHFSSTDPDGKSKEEQREAGSVTWEKPKLETIVNLSPDALDTIIVELKHPFCYQPANVTRDDEDETDETVKGYVKNVKESIGKKWVKKMPREIEDGERGLVTVAFRVLRDGTMDEDDIHFSSVFAKDSLAEKALTAVRQAGPFPPFPEAMEKPYIDLHFVFQYNLPATRPAGCQ